MAEATPGLQTSESRIPLIVVHGAGVDHRMMLPLAAAFADSSDFKSVYVDLPGFGKTPRLPAPGGVPELAEWLTREVKKVAGDGPFAILGTSLGGALSLSAAAQLREQCVGIALLAPVVDPIRENRTVPAHVVIAPDADLVAALEGTEGAEDYLALAVVQSEDTWSAFRTTVLPGLESADPVALTQMAERYYLEPLPGSELAGFAQPVLVVTGRQDAVVGYQDQWELAGQFPRCTFAVLDSCGHNVQIEQPRSVETLVQSWIADVSTVIRGRK